MHAIVFPFLSLPEKVQATVVTTMCLLEQASVSFCSTKAKALVASLKITPYRVDVDINSHITIRLCGHASDLVVDFYEENDADGTVEFIAIPKPVYVEARLNIYDGSTVGYVDWRNQAYEMKDWVDHLVTVFRQPQCVELNFGEGCQRFATHSIDDTMMGFKFTGLTIDRGLEGRSKIAALRALQRFPITEELIVWTNPFEEPHSVQKVLTRNYDSSYPLFSHTLNDLLPINSLHIQLTSSNLTEKDVNRFLKLWIRGSNPRLESLTAHLRPMENDEAILRGIRHTIVPEQRRRNFRPSTKRRLSQIVRGGYDITRYDGTVATIQIFLNGGWRIVYINVWSRN